MPILSQGVWWIMSLNATAVLIIIMLTLVIISFRISAYLMKRAVCTVVEIFRQNNAIQFQNAMTLEDLGLGPPPLFKLRRDYKPYAVQMLVQSSIIRMTPDDRFYLVEENPSLGNISCPVNLKGFKTTNPLEKEIFRKQPTWSGKKK